MHNPRGTGELSRNDRLTRLCARRTVDHRVRPRVPLRGRPAILLLGRPLMTRAPIQRADLAQRPPAEQRGVRLRRAGSVALFPPPLDP